MLARVVEQDVGAEDVGLDELGGAEDRAVDMRLGREVNDRSATLGRGGDGGEIGNVGLEKLDVRAVEVGPVARVGELVEDDDLVASCGEPLCEVRPDEAGAAGDEDSHRQKPRGRAASALPRPEPACLWT